MTRYMTLWVMLLSSCWGKAQTYSWQPDVTVQQTYTVRRSSSTDPTGGNVDYRTASPGETITILDASGRHAAIAHIWITLNDEEQSHPKRIVLRMYWDDEQSPVLRRPLTISSAWVLQNITCGNLKCCQLVICKLWTRSFQCRLLGTSQLG